MVAPLCCCRTADALVVLDKWAVTGPLDHGMNIAGIVVYVCAPQPHRVYRVMACVASRALQGVQDGSIYAHHSFLGSVLPRGQILGLTGVSQKGRRGMSVRGHHEEDTGKLGCTRNVLYCTVQELE